MYRVHLDQFEGPLDLLLFFIRRDELDVYDIPIAQIADEFLGYVRILEQVDLDSAADFIYMAAMLIQIKARMLLPRPEFDEEGEAIDPRKELVERLLEYMRYKEAAMHLERTWTERHELFPRGAASAVQLVQDEAEVSYKVSLFDLIGVLQNVLDRSADVDPYQHETRRYDYSVEDQRDYVLQQASGRSVSFVELVSNRPRSFVIVTFLAVLDLLQQQLLTLTWGVDAQDFALEARPGPDQSGAPRSAQTVAEA